MIKFIKIADPDNSYDITNIEITIVDQNVCRDSLIEEFIAFVGACGYSTKDLNEYLNEDPNASDVEYK